MAYVLFAIAVLAGFYAMFAKFSIQGAPLVLMISFIAVAAIIVGLLKDA